MIVTDAEIYESIICCYQINMSTGQALEVGVLVAQVHVLGADLIAAVDPLLHPVGAAGCGLAVALLHPFAGEPGVVDAARPRLLPGVPDDRLREDGRQVRVEAGARPGRDGIACMKSPSPIRSSGPCSVPLPA